MLTGQPVGCSFGANGGLLVLYLCYDKLLLVYLVNLIYIYTHHVKSEMAGILTGLVQFFYESFFHIAHLRDFFVLIFQFSLLFLQ